MRRYSKVGTEGAALRDCLNQEEGRSRYWEGHARGRRLGALCRGDGHCRVKAESREKPGELGPGSLALPPARLRPGSVA